MTFYHPKGNIVGTQEETGIEVKSHWGVFSETRGIKNPTPFQKEVLVRSVPAAGWFEPGQWLWLRSLDKWKYCAVPTDHIYLNIGQYEAPKGTFYGGEIDPYLDAVWNDWLDTGGIGGDDVYGIFKCYNR